MEQRNLHLAMALTLIGGLALVIIALMIAKAVLA